MVLDDGVIPPIMERVAFKKPSYGEIKGPEERFFFEGFQGI